MKRRIGMLLCLIWICAMAGCGSSASGKPGAGKPAGVSDVLEQGMAEADAKSADDTAPAADSGVPKDKQDPGSTDPSAQDPFAGSGSAADTALIPAGLSGGIDVDLTLLSSTMVYSEVYNMISSPGDYIGKTVKMKGPFAYYHDEATNNYYFACIIRDATACCAQGIEFVLADDYTYPEDYPEVGEEICVIGVFDIYTEGSYTYCTLRNARLI